MIALAPGDAMFRVAHGPGGPLLRGWGRSLRETGLKLTCPGALATMYLCLVASVAAEACVSQEQLLISRPI